MDQSSYGKSHKLVQIQAARPDFLVMEPHKMPFFVDVKAQEMRTPEGPKFFLKNPEFEAVFLSVKGDFLPLRQFQNLVGIPVWIAWFERIGRKIRPEKMYVAPVNALNDFVRGQPKWEWMQFPLECCTTIDLKRGGNLDYDVKDDHVKKFLEMLDHYIETRGWKG